MRLSCYFVYNGWLLLFFGLGQISSSAAKCEDQCQTYFSSLPRPTRTSRTNRFGTSLSASFDMRRISIRDQVSFIIKRSCRRRSNFRVYPCRIGYLPIVNHGPFCVSKYFHQSKVLSTFVARVLIWFDMTSLINCLLCLLKSGKWASLRTDKNLRNDKIFNKGSGQGEDGLFRVFLTLVRHYSNRCKIAE